MSPKSGDFKLLCVESNFNYLRFTFGIFQSTIFFVHHLVQAINKFTWFSKRKVSGTFQGILSGKQKLNLNTNWMNWWNIDWILNQLKTTHPNGYWVFYHHRWPMKHRNATWATWTFPKCSVLFLYDRQAPKWLRTLEHHIFILIF